MSHEYKTTRNLHEQGGSLLITLPKFWVEALGLKKGDQVTLVVNDTLTIIPPSEQTAKPSKENQP